MGRPHTIGWSVTLAIALTGALMAGAGCLAPNEIVCADGTVCPADRVCAPAGGGCPEAEQVSACEGQAEGAPCTLGSIGGGTCRAGVCAITGCGDGAVDVGEACDDGNEVDDDACTNTCTLPVCGDRIRQGGEACDEGVANGDDRACTSTCAVATCGDGLVQAGVEACDVGAGNADTGACTLACAANVCGDGKAWLGVEGCDDGNAIDDDGCRDSCALPSCGDGVTQSGEACDLGAGNGDDRACTAACQANTCGDGKVLLGVEACDLGVGNADTGACTLACGANVCGDGKAWLGVEPCDDGNTASGDGCRGDCRKVEACGDSEVDAGEGCDDGAAGAANPADGCDACAVTAWQAAAVLGAEPQGTDVGLASPRAVAVDRAGNLFIADFGNHRIRKMAAGTGVISTVAGTGTQGFSGDGGAATSAQLAIPHGVAVDGAGNLFIADYGNHRVRKVAAGTGVISTVAGTGTGGFAGDGGAATSAQIYYPIGVAVDGAGNLFIADSQNSRIRRVAAGSGTISTVAGSATRGFAGDGGLATSAQLNRAAGIAVDEAGNLFIADKDNNRIRKVTAGSGVISTVAGTGTNSYSGDGGAATSAHLNSPSSVAVDGAGNVLIADALNHRVRKVTAGSGVISTVVGIGSFGFSGDGGAAISARLLGPIGVAVDGVGDLFVVDEGNGRIRKVAAGSGIISTVAGNGNRADSGDGGAAISAPLFFPAGVAVDSAGNLFIADQGNNRIRKVAAGSGVISTVAGTGSQGFAGDGGAATSAQFDSPRGVAVDGAGNLFIADYGNHRIRKVTAGSGVITTVAGSNSFGFTGDGGPATSALLRSPYGVAVDGAGNLYIADWGNHAVRKVAAGSGIITTVAGTGIQGFSGDGGASSSAQLARPGGVAVDGAGNLIIADTFNHRIRQVDAGSGVITTVAGTGVVGFSGDGGGATSAQLTLPWCVAMDSAGNLFIADKGNQRVRQVAAGSGIISTVAGTGSADFSGDGGAATNAALREPYGVAVDVAGNLFIADANYNHIRQVEAGTGLISTVAGVVAPAGMGPLSQAFLADPRALWLAPDFTLIAGGTTGTVQALRPVAQVLEVVAGRYPHTPATGTMARLRDASFGTVGGVAYDAALGRIYLAETTAHRLQVVTIADPADLDSWTMTTLAGDAAGLGTAGFADGPALAARFDAPAGLYFDEAERVLYVADAGNQVIRTVPIDAAGATGDVSTIAGTPRTLGYFGDGFAATDALLYAPQAITRCGNGDLFIADTSNQRVRRVDAASGVISTVLGDGVAASSGQGLPARTFPVDTPLGLACDPFGNLLVTSRTVVRLVVADADGTVDGSGAVQTIYGAPPRTEYPASVTTCLTGIAVVDAETVQVTDSCTGVLAELWRQPLAP